MSHSYHLTLYASDKDITPGHISKLEHFCEENALPAGGRVSWLTPRRSAQLVIGQQLDMSQMIDLRGIFEAERMDIFCTPVRETPYQLLLADMDSTMVTGETLDEMAARAGIGEHVAAITKRAMNGELDFEGALRERVGLLKGKPVAIMEDTLMETHATEGAADFIKHLKDNGAACVLVSGGFTFFTGAIAQRLGFDHHHGNILDIEDGHLAGTVTPPILGKEAKLAYLKEYTQKIGCDLADTIAIGDGANDLPMLQAAGLGIGYRPKPLLEASLLNILRFAPLSLLNINHSA